MNIHLLHSKGVAESIYTEVLEFLQSFDGPVRFIEAGLSRGLPARSPAATSVFNSDGHDDAAIPDGKKIRNQASQYVMQSSWTELFTPCQVYRERHKLPSEDLVIMLTNLPNEYNWFSALDPANPVNGFVHTGEWERYVRCSEVFPVAYLVASLVLQKHMFSTMEELKQAVHTFPLGCINDFCNNKQEVILKLRTADICTDCMKLLDGKLQPVEVQQMLTVFEAVRLRILFNQNFRQNLKPSRLHVSKHGRVFLPDYGNIEIKLTPLEKTLYLFYLNHPEGVLLTELATYKEEFRRIYSRISTSGLLAEIHSRVDGLLDLSTNSANEKISKIKKAFVKAIGEELAQKYYIQGEHGDKKLVPLEGLLRTNDLIL